MSLVRFVDQLTGSGKGGPPVSIRAKDLDDNFKTCLVSPDKKGIYKVKSSAEMGSELEFSAYNIPVSWQQIAVCVDGVSKTMWVLGTEPQ